MHTLAVLSDQSALCGDIIHNKSDWSKCWTGRLNCTTCAKAEEVGHDVTNSRVDNFPTFVVYCFNGLHENV